ncbi:MAG: YkgJ family cysteine cluster protein [Methanoregulaceae archaeon]|nr:YkgJ family cysteine cluster protein [Methanoregulaceae archaeon]
MARFVCTRCGKCCMSLGRHIRIERSISAAQHYCRVTVTGELLPVAVHPQHRDLFSSGERDPSWCPFLRKEDAGLFTCTIYETRPRICREFRCRTMIIYGPGGREAGCVKGRRSLVTNDPVLESAWREIPPDSNDAVLKEILRKHSYLAELLE